MQFIKKYFISSITALLSFTLLIATARSQENKIPSAKFRLPVISLGTGILNFNGDVGYSKLNQPLTARSAFQLEIQNFTEKRLSFALFVMAGKTMGEEKTINRALNFSSSIVSEGFMLRYDFLCRKRQDQVLIPYLTAGAEYIFFHSTTDLFDASGRRYNYWNDGTIRNIAQDDPAADQAVKISRDYHYETDLRDANLDGYGKYRSSTWGIPIGAGVRFKISDRCSMHFSSVYHITGSDFIDGVAAGGKGMREGDAKKDKMFFSSVTFRFALSPKYDEYSDIDFNALVNEDADKDGITDINDDSSGTPLNNMVDVNGKPYDNDNDGIPDYRDKELNTPADSVVNEEGVMITEQMIEEQYRKDSLAALPAVIEYIKSFDRLAQRNPQAEKRWLDKKTGNQTGSPNPVPPLYRDLDIDSNGIITPKEISRAIDDYLAKKSPYTVPEFFDLIDFFFQQQ